MCPDRESHWQPFALQDDTLSTEPHQAGPGNFCLLDIGRLEFNKTTSNYCFFKDFIYLFFREGKGGKKKGRETSMCGCLLCAPPTGDQAGNPDVCPRLGIELVTL